MRKWWSSKTSSRLAAARLRQSKPCVWRVTRSAACWRSSIAEKVVEEFPDRYLGAYVYSYYQAPPRRVKPHPNLALVLAPDSGRAYHVTA